MTTADWLAYIDLMAGSGTWARGADRDDTIRRVLRSFKRDWSQLFELRGAEVTVHVANVTGHERVTFASGNVFAGDYGTGERIEPVEHIHHIYPGKPKRKPVAAAIVLAATLALTAAQAQAYCTGTGQIYELCREQERTATAIERQNQILEEQDARQREERAYEQLHEGLVRDAERLRNR